MIRKASLHRCAVSKTSLVVRPESPARGLDDAPQPDAGEDILDGPTLGGMEMHVVLSEQRNAQASREIRDPLHVQVVVGTPQPLHPE